MSFLNWLSGGSENFETATPLHRAEILLKHTPKDSPRAIQLKKSLNIMTSKEEMRTKLYMAEDVRKNDSLVWLNLILALNQEPKKVNNEGIFILDADLPGKVKEARSFTLSHKFGGQPHTPEKELAAMEQGKAADEALKQFIKHVEKALKPLFGAGFQEEKPTDHAHPDHIAKVTENAANDNQVEDTGEEPEAQEDKLAA